MKNQPISEYAPLEKIYERARCLKSEAYDQMLSFLSELAMRLPEDGRDKEKYRGMERRKECLRRIDYIEALCARHNPKEIA